MVTYNLEGVSVLVTGGGSGLGSTISRNISELGAAVSCISLESKEKSSFPNPSLYFEGDIFSDGTLNYALNEIYNKLGKIDVLINNIGTGMNGTCDLLKIEDFEKMFNLNVLSQLRMINFLKKRTNKNSKLRIINMSSTFSRAALPTLEGYASTKNASLEMTKQLSKEVNKSGFTYICLCPGYFRHPKHLQYFSSKPGRLFLRDRIPMRRLGYPVEELSTIIATFCLPVTQDIKYTEIYVDGGLSAYCGRE